MLTIGDGVTVRNTPGICGTITDTTTVHSPSGSLVTLHKVDGAWWSGDRLDKVEPEPTIGATVKVRGMHAVVRFIFCYANGLTLLDTNRGTFDRRECQVA